jgi:hypothetical protein
MNLPPRITVLGIHKVPFDELGVEGHLETICPPYSDELRRDVREMLDSTVLLEMLIEGRDDRFDVRDFRQPDTAQPWSWLYPIGLVCVWFLSPDGDTRNNFDDDDDYDGTGGN